MNERLSKLLNNQKLVATSIGIVSFGTGISIGYILGRRQAKNQTHTVPSVMEEYFTTDELAELREISERNKIEASKANHPSNIPKPPDLAEVGKEFAESIVNVTEIEPEVEEESVRKSIFVTTEDDWDWEVEKVEREGQEIYILHKDEFYADEREYSQITLTYYSGDDILVDEEDSPIYNHAQVVGPLKFGHGSGDPNVFHVRNEKLRAEYEILFDPGLYSVEVLGLEIENNARAQDLKHSHQQRKYKRE